MDKTYNSINKNMTIIKITIDTVDGTKQFKFKIKELPSKVFCKKLYLHLVSKNYNPAAYPTRR